MVRSVWVKALGTLLVGTGLVWGQQPTSAPGKSPASGEVITLQEAGKPEQKCKVLRTWKTPEGHVAHQVQVLGAGGGLLIVVEGTPVAGPGGGQALTTRIFHQGRDGTWPAGTPLPPVRQTTYSTVSPGTPAPTARNGATPMPAGPAAPTASGAGMPVVVTEVEEERPPLGSRVRQMASHLFHRDQPEEMPVIVQGGPAPGATPVVGQTVVVPQASGAVTQVTEVPGDRPPLGSRVKDFTSHLLHRDQTETVTVVQSGPPAAPTASPPATPPAKPAAASPIQKVSATGPQTAPVPPAAAPAAAKIAPVPAAPAAWPPAYAGPPDARTGTSYADNPIVSMSPPVGGAPPQKTRMIPVAQPAPAVRPVSCDCKPATAPAPVVVPAAAPVIVSNSGPCCACECASGPVIVQGSAADPTAPKGLRGRLASLLGKGTTPPGGEVVVIAPPPAAPAATPIGPTATTISPTAIGPGTPTVTAPTPAKVAVEPARSSDWRESWGKPAPSKTEVVSTPKKEAPKAEVASVPVKAPAPLPPPSPAPTVVIPRKSDVSYSTPRLAPLPVADTKHPDPLTQPETFAPAEGRPLTGGVVDRTARADGTRADGTPMGVRSVLDAGAPQYVPVAIVTEPDYRRPPEPPAPHVPQPPPPDYADVSNAFTNPSAAPPAAPQPPVQANAFTPAPAPVDPTVAAGGAFGPTGATAPVPGAYPPGYGPRMPGTYPPAAYNPMMRGMAPPMPPSGPGAPAAYPPSPAGTVPAAYPPNPAALPAAPAAPAPGIRPAGYQVAMAGPVAPSAPAASPGGTSSLAESVTTLRDSLYPSQREWAADALASYDWRTHPDAVHALLLGAREDPAASVRAACVRALGRMKAESAPVVSALQALKNDGDPRVLHEVEEALATLTAEPAAR